jgi:TolB-like protein
MGSGPRAIYRFDHFTLDLVRGGLFAEGGAQLALRPKSFDLLRYMVVNAGRLVDRDELMQAVWPNVFVTEESVGQCVKDIRRALGDPTQRLLRTVQRRGYLLDVTASTVAEGAPLAATVAAAAAPLPTPPRDRRMVVVMPFETIGRDPEQDYLADGITADLVTDLTRFQDLHVVSPLQRGYGPLALDPSAPGWRLPAEANYVLTGSVRRAAERVRITVQLRDAETGVVIWAERLDGPIEDLFAIQDQLADRLPAHLVSRIEREGLRRAQRRPPIGLDAYDLCLRGRELHARSTEADTLAARELFGRAIELDPGYATAYAGQAWTVQRGFTHLWGEPRGEEAADLALRLARRSVEIEPDSPLCLARLAFILLLTQSWEEAIETARAAVRANPCAVDPRHVYGEVLAHSGDPEAAEREISLALSLEPFHQAGLKASLGRALLLADHPADALPELRWCAARLPDYGPCYQTLAIAAAETGRIDEARAAVGALQRIHPGLTVRKISETWFFRDPALVMRFRAGLRAAGMPEG